MRKLLERPTPTINPASFTEEIETIDRRLPEIDATLAQVEPERAIAAGLADRARLAAVNDRIAKLEIERAAIVARRAEIIATLRTARDAELTAWERERWQPALVAVRRERAARMARCRELADALVSAMEDVKQHPAEVVRRLDEIESARWTIAGRYDVVPGSVDRPTRPGETELDFAAWKAMMHDIDAILNPTRQGIPIIVGPRA